MTRREMLSVFPAIPFLGKLFVPPQPPKGIIRVLPFYLFPRYKPGDKIFWYESPYWDVKLSGRVYAINQSNEYKYLIVRPDERSTRKLTDKTRFPVWAMQVQPMFEDIKNFDSRSTPRKGRYNILE